MTNKPDKESHEALKRQLTALERQLKELTASLPAHSLSPSMLTKLEDLEEKLDNTRRELSRLSERLAPPPAE